MSEKKCSVELVHRTCPSGRVMIRRDREQARERERERASEREQAR